MPVSFEKQLLHSLNCQRLFIKRFIWSDSNQWRSATNQRISLNGGFTLIELLTTLGILAVIVATLIALSDPFKQLVKGKDGRRSHDLLQIRNALDTYYNDFNCYPQTLSFGSEWKVGDAVYMKKVPQDPECATTGLCYVYQTDGSACPQWHVVYASLRGAQSTAYIKTVAGPWGKQVGVTNTSCSVWQTCNYAPHSGYNACVVAGSLNCSVITSSFPGPTEAMPTPTPTKVPTPTPCMKNYGCRFDGFEMRCKVLPAGTGETCDPRCDGLCR